VLLLAIWQRASFASAGRDEGSRRQSYTARVHTTRADEVASWPNRGGFKANAVDRLRLEVRAVRSRTRSATARKQELASLPSGFEAAIGEISTGRHDLVWNLRTPPRPDPHGQIPKAFGRRPSARRKPRQRPISPPQPRNSPRRSSNRHQSRSRARFRAKRTQAQRTDSRIGRSRSAGRIATVVKLSRRIASSPWLASTHHRAARSGEPAAALSVVAQEVKLSRRKPPRRPTKSARRSPACRPPRRIRFGDQEIGATIGRVAQILH